MPKLKDVLVKCVWCGGTLEESDNHPHCRTKLKHWVGMTHDEKQAASGKSPGKKKRKKK